MNERKTARQCSSRKRLVEDVRGCEQAAQALLKGKHCHLYDLLHHLHPDTDVVASYLRRVCRLLGCEPDQLSNTRPRSQQVSLDQEANECHSTKKPTSVTRPRSQRVSLDTKQ